MDTFQYEKKNLNDTQDETNKDDENSDQDELIAFYFFKYCSCPAIFFFMFANIFIFFIIPFFSLYCCRPYKRMIKIDKKNKILIIYNTGVIPCCKLTSKSYSLNDIKKIRMYVYSTPDRKVGFNKLYFINCEIHSLNEIKEELFSEVRYDKETFDRCTLFFKKYFETEIEPLEIAKDKSEYNLNEQAYANI